MKIKGAKMHGQILRGLAAYAAVAASAAVLASDANGGGLLDLAAPVERWEDGIPLGNGGAEECHPQQFVHGQEFTIR